MSTSPPIPKCEPESATAGDTWEWDRAVPAYPPSGGWVLSYTLTGPGDPVTVPASASADGDWYEVRLDAQTNAGLTPGSWTLAGMVNRGASRYTVYFKPLDVRPNVEAVTGPVMSETEQELADLVALRATLQPGGIAKLTIAGRTIEYRSVDQLDARIAKLRIAISAARNPRSLAATVTFTR